jgi:hypothetical protein
LPRSLYRIKLKGDPLMPKTDNNISKIQQKLLIPAIDQIVTLLGKKGIHVSLSITADSITVSFVGKNGKECEYRCWIRPAETPRIYRNFVRPAIDHGEYGIDFSGAFVNEIKLKTIVTDFQSIFRFCF